MTRGLTPPPRMCRMLPKETRRVLRDMAGALLFVAGLVGGIALGEWLAGLI